MDEVTEEGAPEVQTVGERLREAREARGLTLEEVAAQTRIPVRHLTSLETGDWARLPAPTYSIGFAKNYAGAVGLDKPEIVDQLRYEMGGYRPASAMTADAFEPVDPKRQMPKGLVFGALGVLLLVIIGLSWLSNRQLDEGTDQPAPATNNAAASVAPPPAAVAPAATAVTISASAPAWVEIKDGTAVLKQGELAAGETFALPPNAAAPTLSTAKPEALTIKVGNQVVPPIGPAGRKVEVSLRPADLMKAPAAAAPAATKPAPKPEAKAPTATRRAPPATARVAATPPAPVSNGVASPN